MIGRLLSSYFSAAYNHMIWYDW